jgi:hypothetical protein
MSQYGPFCVGSIRLVRCSPRNQGHVGLNAQARCYVATFDALAADLRSAAFATLAAYRPALSASTTAQRHGLRWIAIPPRSVRCVPPARSKRHAQRIEHACIGLGEVPVRLGVQQVDVR